jgi:allantoate deiminase
VAASGEGTIGSSSAARADLVMSRCNELATCSEEPGRITRPYGSAALTDAMVRVAGWMEAAGMTTRRDAIGNLRGRYEGSDLNAAALLLGSHLDSVRDAGRFDGPLGVLVAIAAVERLHRERRRLPFPIDVIAFADEEGLRFQTAYLGSKAVAGVFDTSLLDRRDGSGISLLQAILAFGGDVKAIPDAALRPNEAFAYVETHIEQGPHLESVDLPLGVVTAIAGQTRVGLDFRGEAGHAGTVAMALRRDSLPAAAEFILDVERTARESPGLVATVGQVAVEPGASNVIPSSVNLSLDVRHPDDAVRRDAVHALEHDARGIATRRRLGVEWQIVQEQRAVPCDASLSSSLEQAIAGAGLPVERLASGAGHDAVIMSAVVPVAMLFVRCQGGISHNPAESVLNSDVVAAIEVLNRLLDELVKERSS